MSKGPLKRFVREIHRRSLWQVLGIYLLASWAVLSGVGTLMDTLNLPEWFPPLALALLIVGLPIVLATAFVQEGGPGRDGGDLDDAGPAPPRGGTSSLFTWLHAILGSVTAMLLLIRHEFWIANRTSPLSETRTRGDRRTRGLSERRGCGVPNRSPRPERTPLRAIAFVRRDREIDWQLQA